MTTTAIARPILPPGPTPAPAARRRRLRTAQIVHRALLALVSKKLRVITGFSNST